MSVWSGVCPGWRGQGRHRSSRPSRPRRSSGCRRGPPRHSHRLTEEQAFGLKTGSPNIALSRLPRGGPGRWHSAWPSLKEGKTSMCQALMFQHLARTFEPAYIQQRDRCFFQTACKSISHILSTDCAHQHSPRSIVL